MFGALLDGDPVLFCGAYVHLVGADEVVLLGFLGDGALRPDGCDVAQESQIHLAKQGGERVNFKIAERMAIMITTY